MTIKSLICLTLLVACGTVAYSDTPDAGVRILVHQASQLPIPKAEQAEYTEWLEKVDKNLEGRRPVYEMEVDAGTRGLLDFLETTAAQQMVFSLQQDAAKLTLTSAGMTVTADKNTVTGESGTVIHNMQLAFGLVQGSIVREKGYAYFFPMKEEDNVTDDFFEMATSWVEAHVPSTSVPHVLIEFRSPDGGRIYVFFESADDGKSAKIRKIFYVSPEDLQYS